MTKIWESLLALLSLSKVVFSLYGHSSYEVVFSWKEIDFRYPTPQARQKSLESRVFIPENTNIAGIKVHGDRVFLTAPRWRRGVPSTLNVVELNPASGNFPRMESSPNLEPYPSWETQEIGNCSAFQFVQSMEIDQHERMWVLDTGRVSTWNEALDNVQNLCPAKLLIIDLKTNKIIKRHEFPASVISPTENYLNDIVLDCSAGMGKCWAYMSEASGNRIIVYQLEKDKSWYVHHPTMSPDPILSDIPILGANYTFVTGINGIALSPSMSGHDRIYYNPVNSFETYSVSTFPLRQASNGQLLSNASITFHPNFRTGQIAGFAMSSNGLLFYGLLPSNAVAFIDTIYPHDFQRQSILVQNDVELQWPDTFAFDNEGYLYFVCERLHRFRSRTMDWSDDNIRVVRVFVGSKNYMYMP